MNIVVDPHMFGLEDEEEIRRNIHFFQALVFLCKTGRINVFLYKELVERMLTREVIPFPIFLGRIRDDDFRNLLIQLNAAFNKAMMNTINQLDIEPCNGEQNFTVNDMYLQRDRLLEDEAYFELLSVLLQSCYNEKLELSDKIATGDIDNAIGIGDCFSLLCSCKVKKYEKKYTFESIDVFETNKDKAFLDLEQMAVNNHILYVDSPIIERGSHHNKLQFNSDFTSYEGLSRINKSVISSLRCFGLNKIIFGEFHEDSSRPKGTIVVYDVIETENYDILKGWLFAETGFRNHVDLYFQKNVGNNLKLYLEGEFVKVDVERLRDSLSL